MKKVIVRVKGGLGNQLFCYAAARRLALVNDAELVIDEVSGFVRDYQYRRQYSLDRFNIRARCATPTERLEPLERYRRSIKRWVSRRRPFGARSYLEQEGFALDDRLLSLKVKGTLYLDGLWQSETYFKDVEDSMREDLKIIPPSDTDNERASKAILGAAPDSVALHVRWFDAPGGSGTHNASVHYYQRAIAFMEAHLRAPHYFLFSDNPEAARARLELPSERITVIAHNQGDQSAFADLWLMSQCRHFITANSTFSWWGAWLGQPNRKLVVTPDLKIEGKAAWGFQGLIPPGWVTL